MSEEEKTDWYQSLGMIRVLVGIGILIYWLIGGFE